MANGFDFFGLDFSNFSATDILGGAAGLAGQFFGQPEQALIPVSPVVPTSYAPSYGFESGGAYDEPVGIPVASSTAIAIRQATAPILFKIAEKLGRRSLPTLTWVVSLIRRLLKVLAPGAIAATLGITLADLATLLTAHARKKRRRMNPANARALRKSIRRLCAFERLADRTHASLAMVASPRSRARRKGKCRVCRSSPCRC